MISIIANSLTLGGVTALLCDHRGVSNAAGRLTVLIRRKCNFILRFFSIAELLLL